MGMKMLVLDFDKLMDVDTQSIDCSYPFHPTNPGVAYLMEMASMAVVCRRCEQEACVNACPVEAIEKDESGFLVRHNLRCIGCQSCVAACPFGTLHSGGLIYMNAYCDLCTVRGLETPTCVGACPDALQVEDIEGPNEDEGLFVVDIPAGRFAVRCAAWKKVEEEAAQSKGGPQ